MAPGESVFPPRKQLITWGDNLFPPFSEAQHNVVTASDESSLFCYQMSNKTTAFALKLTAVH